MTELPRPPPFTRSVTLGVLRNIDQVEGAGLDVRAAQPGGEPAKPYIRIDGSSPALRQRKIQTDLGVQSAAVGIKLGPVPGATRRDINVVSIHRGIEQDEGLIRRQALAAIDRGGVGMAEPRAAMLVGKVGHREGDVPLADSGADDRIVSITTIDLRDDAGGAVDDIECILANQKPDLVTRANCRACPCPDGVTAATVISLPRI